MYSKEVGCDERRLAETILNVGRTKDSSQR